MARLLVVSRSMALAMRIADDHDVVEYPVERLQELAPPPDVQAIVLDLGEPFAAMQTLDRLRERGFTTPVLIVSGYQPAWKELVDLHIERVVVVPLPITRAALLGGVERLLDPASHRPSSKRPAPPESVGTTPPPAAPIGAETGPEPADGDAERRPGGLSRWLTRGGARGGTGQPGGSEVGEPATRNGSPLSPPTGPVLQPEPAEDLFRPVVEPAVPVRSPSTLPRRPVSEPPPPPAPAPAAAARPAPAAPSNGTPALTVRGDHGGAAPPARPLGLRERPVSKPAPQPVPQPDAKPDSRPESRRPAPAPPAPDAQPAAPPISPAAPAPLAGPLSTPGSGRGGDRRRDRSAERHPGFTQAAGVGAPRPEQPDDVQMWVRALLDHRAELFGVAETAQVLADEVVERGESDAAAVLVPDGTRWRVSGGVGLRPLERRLLLDTSNWLISEIAIGGRALLIEDTDIVRPRLAGAPLAAWRHLLAVPVPGMRAAVVLARGQEAARFTERDLATVVPLVAEAGPLLAAALQMRELARALAPMRDVDH